MESVDYRRPLTDLDRSVQFTQMKLKNDDDVKTMFSLFGMYFSKGPTELDASFFRSFKDIRESLIRPKKYKEIRACMDIQDEKVCFANL